MTLLTCSALLYAHPMTVQWLRGSYTVAPAPRDPEVVLVVDEDTQEYAPIDVNGDLGAAAIEVRATEMGPARTGGQELLMLTALLTDLSVNLTASAIWEGIVTAVRGVFRARRPRCDHEQRFVLTVIIPTASGDRVVESEAIGDGAVEAGLAATERIVSEILSGTVSR